MNLRERQSSRKYIVPPIPSSPLGLSAKGPSRSPTNANNNSSYESNREATLRPGVRFRKTASSLRIIATKGNATLTAGLSYPKIHNPDLELYQKLKKREHEFAEAITPAVAPFQYIPSPTRDAELSVASARLYRPQTAQQPPNPPSVDLKFDAFGNWYQDMKLKVHMRLVQSQQIKTDNNPLEQQPDTQPHSHYNNNYNNTNNNYNTLTLTQSSKSKKKSKKDHYDTIDPSQLSSPEKQTPTKEKIKDSSAMKSARKMSLKNMKDILPSAREKNKKNTQQAWEASRESWFAESTPHQASNPSTPKQSRIHRSSSFSSHTTPHTYIPSSPADSPLRPRSRTQAPRPAMSTPVNTSSIASSVMSSSASSMASSVSNSPLSPSPTSATTPHHHHLPMATITTTTTTSSSTTTSASLNNPQLSQPVFLSRGKKMHSEYDIRKIRFKARNSVGLEGIVE